MAIVSQTKFAKMTGRSRQAISQRAKRGTLVALKNGKLDTEDLINASFLREVEEDKSINSGVSQVESNTSSNNLGGPPGPPGPPTPVDHLTKSASDAKRGQEVLKYKKLEIEIKTMQGDLVLRESIGNACFGYLSTLNINIMEMPQSFLDELEAVIINKGSRSEKMEIVTKPICDAIGHAILQIERVLKLKDNK